MTAEERTIPLGLDIGIFTPPAPETIYTARRETNAAFFRDILSLYVADGAAVTDLTWGLGNFWTLVDTRRWRLTRIDKYRPADIQASCCAVPLEDGTQDVVVFDPPYVLPMGTRPGAKHNLYAELRRDMEDRFGLTGSDLDERFGITAHGPQTEDEIDALYAGGMAEAHRILKPKGLLILKTMDTSRWRHVSLANTPGWRLIDLFIVVNSPPGVKHQKHARKNHSYFMVFHKEGK